VGATSRMIADVTRSLVCLVLLLAACREPERFAASPAEIVDLSASFEELRADFDAHRGEPRFLTLLAPS
jgi:hypothetical protein